MNGAAQGPEESAGAKPGFIKLNRETGPSSGVAEEQKTSRRGSYLAVAIVVALLLLAILGFLVKVPTASEVGIPYVSTSVSETPVPLTSAEKYPTVVPTTTAYSFSNATVIVNIHEVSTTAQVLTVSRTTLYCNQSVYTRTYLPAGAYVRVLWNATGKVDAYVFDSAQFEYYQGSGQITSTTANETGEANGSMGFQTKSSDSYFFLLLDPPVGGSCLGTGTIWVSSPGGPADYVLTFTSYTTEFGTYTTTVQTNATETRTTTVTVTSMSTELVPYTLTSTSTTECALSFWSWLLGTRSC